jgi:chaperonin GroEL
MAAKKLLFRSAAREKIFSGTTPLADAVRITLGPNGSRIMQTRI